MKKLIVMALLLAGTQMAFAQSPKSAKTPEQMTDKKIKHLTEALQLTEAQQTQLHPALLASEKKLLKEHIARETAQNNYRTIRMEQDETIAAVLSEEQKKQYLELKKERKAKRKSHKGDYHRQKAE